MPAVPWAPYISMGNSWAWSAEAAAQSSNNSTGKVADQSERRGERGMERSDFMDDQAKWKVTGSCGETRLASPIHAENGPEFLHRPEKKIPAGRFCW